MSRIDRAYTFHTSGDLASAENLYRSMIRDGEDSISAANNLFALLQSQKRTSELIELYRQIEHLMPANGEWGAELAVALLSREQYPAGWLWYEARRHTVRGHAPSPSLSIPEWRGEPVQRLLIWREQGLGDEIQFARYVPLLADRGIAATLLCDPSLERLFADLPARVVGLKGSVKLGEYDAWCLMGSLPLWLGEPFEIPPPLKIQADWSSGGGIGVMTAGAPHHGNDRNRSLPADAAARLLALPRAVSLRPEDTGARDFQDTAEIVAGLDLVVTVDTSVAHLAGSMGKPVWVLLPNQRVDWRWLRGRADSPWYPSARLFRSKPESDWHDVVTEVLAALS